MLCLVVLREAWCPCLAEQIHKRRGTLFECSLERLMTVQTHLSTAWSAEGTTVTLLPTRANRLGNNFSATLTEYLV